MIRDMTIGLWPVWLLAGCVVVFVLCICRAARLADDDAQRALSDWEVERALRPSPSPVEVELVGGDIDGRHGLALVAAVAPFLDPELFDDRRGSAHAVSRPSIFADELPASAAVEASADHAPAEGLEWPSSPAQQFVAVLLIGAIELGAVGALWAIADRAGLTL